MIKVLGTAQDAGFPQIGCYCQNCLLARKSPELARLVTSLALCDLKEKKYYLLDATPDIKAQTHAIHTRLDLPLEGGKNTPEGIILTHAHLGHYTGLMFYGYESLSAYRLPVLCSLEMANFLAHNGPWSQLIQLENITLVSPPLEKSYALTSQIQVTPFNVPHRNEYSNTWGVIISGKNKKLLYIPDIQSWEVWEKSIAAEVKKADIALLDGTFFSSDELPERNQSKIGHPLLSASMQILQETVKEGGCKVYFTHLNHTNPTLNPEGEAIRKVKDRGFNLAEEGMEFFL